MTDDKRRYYHYSNIDIVIQFLLVIINLASILVTVYLTRKMRV
ncbi:hypothetical protein SPPN_08845 [Streptococcus pseudopneumoniae IS7493]|nr:hypothetical protein SPPN_08845 [Streptococcus pseudopneumoniae IS7493]